ncbi:MAG: hypothetical protein L3K05_07030, partial [Thermoplasmata archaeon]|nr:hypothetical protein [Thermoplasmata archaeon]
MTEGPMAPTPGRPPLFGPISEGLRRGVRWTIVRARALATEERYRRLRLVLLAGLAVRLVLAPITSWGVDTPYFTLSAVRMLQTGSPYGGYTFFNPPLGPVLELPGFALLSLFGSPEGFVRWFPALGPVAVHTQSVIPYLPTPAALLALKLPLIASDLAVALLLFHAIQRSWGDRVATAAAAAWFLNPLVIWSTAVHGEVDTLAALFVLAALLALERRSAVLTGVFLGLGTFAKLYPVLLVPLAAAVLALDAARGSPMRTRWVPLARLSAGLALSVVPFLPLLSGFAVVIAHQSGNVNFGGLTVLIVFNPNITSIARLWPPGTASALVAVLEATAVVGVALSVGALAVRFARSPPGRIELPDLALLSLGAVAGSLLAILTTQPENIVAVLVPLALAAPVIGRYGARAYWTVSLAAWAQYLTLLTPLAFFYPLFVAIGPGAVGWANRWVVAYALNQGPVPAGAFWILLGVVGGGALIGTWILAAAKTARRFLLQGPSAAGADPGLTAAVVRRVSVPAASMRRMRRPSSATVVVALVLIAMTVETGVATVLLAPPPPALRVSVEEVVAGPGSVATTVRLSTGVTPVAVHVGVVPGFAVARGPVRVFADPAYPDANGSYTATHEIAERVGLALGEAGIPDPISFVDGAALATALASNDSGTVVVLGGTVPDSVLSLSNTTLANWITAGGTLVWAGGPLGGTAGHPSPSGFVWSSLG